MHVSWGPPPPCWVLPSPPRCRRRRWRGHPRRPGPARRRGGAVKSTLKVLDRRLPDDGAKPADDPFGGGLGARGYQRGWIEAGAALTLEQLFLAGQPATVALIGGDDAPLALTVVEPGAGRSCRSARGCRWLPEYSQRYAITLRNPGGARVRYVLVVR